MKTHLFICHVIGWSLVTISCFAQSNQSYTNTIQPGANLIANQLDHGSNTFNDLFPNPGGIQDGNDIRKYNCAGGYTYYLFDSSSPTGWSDEGGTPIPVPTLVPGEGAVFDNEVRGAFSLTFTGTPHVPVLPAPLHCGCGHYNLLSRQTNAPGTYENITGLSPQEGAELRRWAGGSFSVYSFSNGVWSPSVPSVTLGESVLIFPPCSTNCTSPSITTNTTNRTVCAGKPVSFSVTAAGSPPLFYQWQKNGNPISGATSNSYSLSSAQLADAGSYRVIVTNACGSVIGSNVSLVVNRCAVLLTCANNKTVNCGAAWIFDDPVASGGCGGNLTVIVRSTVTNGVCPQVITRNWRATDACGNMAICSQIVTVVNTNPPMLTCASDKVVDCGSVWSFDEPAASDACNGASIAITVLGTVTNGSCPRVITRTWQAADLCNGTATCSQNVTVRIPPPPAITCPSSVLICTNSSGCGVMPDLRRYVSIGSNCELATISQDVPAGSIVCAATGPSGVNVTATDPCTNSSGCLVPFLFDNCGCVAPPASMSAWWPLDENGGSVAQDLAGTANNFGAYNGNPTSVVGAVGNALCFDGTNDFTIVQNDAEVNFAGSCADNRAESFTIAAWVRTDTNGPDLQVLLDKRENVFSPRGYSLFLLDGRLGLQIADGIGGNICGPGAACQDYVAIMPDLRDARWHFIAVTVSRCGASGNVGTFFLDGSIASAFLDPRTGDLNNSANLQIGRRDPAFDALYYKGCIDELEIFKRALAPQEIQRIYQAASAGKCKCSDISAAMIVACASNKTVECGIPWSFDLPTVVDCCGGGVMLSEVNTVTNSSPCEDVIVRTWQASDNCGHSATCSQTVTVRDTTPPSLVCAANKAVNCGSPRGFDQPTAADACSGGNVTIDILSTVTNGVCPATITRTWIATDLCNNSSTCTQMITVTIATPPTITQQPTDVTVVSGETAAFEAIAGGPSPQFFEWYHNGQVLTAASPQGSVLVISNVRLTDAGSYYLIITNIAGAATTHVARLTVLAGSLPDGIRLAISSQQGSNFLDILVNGAAVEFWELQSRGSLTQGEWMTETNGSGSARLVLNPSGGTKFFRVRSVPLTGTDDQLRLAFSRLPREQFDTGRLLDIGGFLSLPLVRTANGLPINDEALIPQEIALTSENFLEAYYHLRRSTLDGNPTLPDLNHITVSVEPTAQPITLEQSLADHDIYALAVAVVPYNSIDQNAWDDGRLGLADVDGNPIDPSDANANKILPKFVVEGGNPGSYVQSNLFAAAGLFRDVLCSHPGKVAFQVPTNFLVTSGPLDDLQIRFSGVPLHYNDGTNNADYSGFVRIEPGKTFLWDFSGVPFTDQTTIGFLMRATINGRISESAGSFKYRAMSAAMPPYCTNVCGDYIYPGTQPRWWPASDWNNRPAAKVFFDGPKPGWWPAYVPWPTPLGFYSTGGLGSVQCFGTHIYNCDPQVWGPLWDSVTGAVGQGTPNSGNNWSCGYNVRLYPASHRLSRPGDNLCQAENLIVIVDGFDLLNSRTQNDLWDDFGPTLQKMLDKGYDVMVLDYTHGAEYIQRNGYALLRVLEQAVPAYLKPEYAEHKVVVVAGSMGTQVARYALCKAEELGKDDHTGLAVYLDGPFLGANIPWSIQGLVRFFAEVANAQGAKNLLAGLSSPAARELARAWLNYGPHPEHVAYYNEANALLNGKALPQHVRNVAIASGSSQGYSLVGSQVGVLNWNLSFAKVDTGEQQIGYTTIIDRNVFDLFTIKDSEPVWGAMTIDAKAEGSAGPILHINQRGGLIAAGYNVLIQDDEWTWSIEQGARPADFSPGGFQLFPKLVVQAYNNGAPAGMNTMTSEAMNHDFIPLFSSLYVRSAENGSEAFRTRRTYFHQVKFDAINQTETLASTRTKADFWYGPEPDGATIDPSIKSKSPFDAIWYQYRNEQHVSVSGQKPPLGAEAFLFNELDQFNSQEPFSSESVLDTLFAVPNQPATQQPKRHSHEVFLFGDLVDGSEDELLTVNTFKRTAMVQRMVNTDGVYSWEKVWEAVGGWIGSWPVKKGDKFFLARLTGGKQLLLSLNVGTPAWAMVQELIKNNSGAYQWSVLWHNSGNGQLGPFRIRPTNLYAFGDMRGDGTNDELVAAYPYVCNNVREGPMPGTSGLSEVSVLAFTQFGPSYSWVERWNNTNRLHWLGGTVVRFGDHLEFGRMDSNLPDALLSVNFLRGIFGGWAVAQTFNSSPGWKWIWSDYGTRKIGSWNFGDFAPGSSVLGDPRDNCHFADLNGSGVDELMNFNALSTQIQDWSYISPGQGNWLPESCGSAMHDFGYYHLHAGDRFFFGNVDANEPSVEVLTLNPQTQGPAVLQRLVPVSAGCWQLIWSSDLDPPNVGFWPLYQ